MTRFEHTTDVARGDWIAPRLHGDFGAVGLVCPTGFEAYARVFHPVVAGDDRRLTWAEVCEVTGRTPHALMQWGHVAGSLHGIRYFGDWDGGEPPTGALDTESLAVLADAIGGDVPATIGVWTGYGHLNGSSQSTFALAFRPDDDEPVPELPSMDGYRPTFDVDVVASPTLELPGRGYALFTGTLAALRDPDWPKTSGWAWRWRDTLNLAWPDDRSWFVASEIDFDSTIVGGSRELVDRVLSSRLESAEVTATSDLSWEGDLINQF